MIVQAKTPDGKWYYVQANENMTTLVDTAEQATEMNEDQAAETMAMYEMLKIETRLVK